jgi:hypothetical protein
MYWFATDMGVPGPSTPLVTGVLRDIAADSDATQTLLQVLNHEVKPTGLLTPRRLAIAAARALRDRPDHIGATSKEIAAALCNEIRRARWTRKTPPGMNGGPQMSRVQRARLAARI